MSHDESVNEGAIHEKLFDMETPGYLAEFDPEEAESMGAFMEDSLSETDLIESSEDLSDTADSGG